MLSLTSLLGRRCSYSDMNMNYDAEKTQGANQHNNRQYTCDVIHAQKAKTHIKPVYQLEAD